MDLKDLRKKIAKMIEEADLTDVTKIIIECNGQEYDIDDIFIDENYVIIQTAERN